MLIIVERRLCLFIFFFNDTATTEIYTLSLHDALPIYTDLFSDWRKQLPRSTSPPFAAKWDTGKPGAVALIVSGLPAGSKDRKSTRLNSSHANISYAVFCLKKKKNKNNHSLPALLNQCM